MYKPATCAQVLLIILLFVQCSWSYTVPNARIQVLSPKGFKVSIPDTNGITLFAFHGNLNERFNGLEAGKWSRDILDTENGRWVYHNRDASLKTGDTLYFWTYVLKDGQGYRQDNGVYVVD